MIARTAVVTLAMVVASASAFLAPSAGVRAGSHLSMGFDNDKLTRAEKKALDVTKKYGAQSPEAAAAWDIYEEIAASDNSAATQPSLADTCELEELAKCDEFQRNMKDLESLVAGGKPVTVDALRAQNKKLLEENARLRRSLAAYK